MAAPLSNLLAARLLPRGSRTVQWPGARGSLLFPFCGSRRLRVSLSAVLESADSVLPCYAVVQQQLKPQVEEEPRRGEDGWIHTLAWTLQDGREIRFEKLGRSKREAKNAAARSLLQELATSEQSAAIMDPTTNGAIAQWAIEQINRRLDASMELQEEMPSEHPDTGGEDEGPRAIFQGQRGPTVHVCTWSCPQVEGEIVARGSATSAAESRRQTMAALYKDLPGNLESVFASVKASEAAAPSGERRTQPSGSDLRASEMNVRHNEVVQKLGIKSSLSYQRLPSGEFQCTVRWSFWDSARNAPTTVDAQGTGRSKKAAAASASEEILIQQGHLPRLADTFHDAIGGIHRSLTSGAVNDAVSSAIRIMEDQQVDVGLWSIFMPEVLRAALVEPDSQPVHSMLSVMRGQLHERGGAPVELWEGLLNEASFSIRNYYQASSALESLRDIPLKESAFESSLDRDYFARFRHLLALERHGSLMSGIHQYELDAQAFVKVPTVDVHSMQEDKVVLTSTPESGIMDLVDGSNRALKASDVVLMVPMEVILEDAGRSPSELDVPEFGDEPIQRSTNWQHPEAWLGSVTSVKGNPLIGEEVRVHTRRISRFSSEVERLDDGTHATISPITLGRQYKLFYIAMETPLARQLAALRCLSRAQFPPWSEFHEGRKLSYNYNEDLRKVLVGPPEEARTAAEAAPRMALGTANAEAAVASLMKQRPWCAVLTESQKTAVGRALDQRLSIIQGPPGTGKTHTACAIIAAWIERYGPLGERILAVADSNVAADNLHTRLRAFGIESVRAGVGKDSPEHALFGDALRRAVVHAQVVVATCIGSGMEVLDSVKDGGNFQRVVVDECTQACEPAALVALGKMCEQAVLIGDHKQLPATVLSKLAQRDGLGISLFERMVNANGLEPTVLQEQRRMHSSIAEFPNKTFYGSQLINAIEDNALPAIPGFNWPNRDCRVCFVDISASQSWEQKRGFSAYNTFEAEALVGVLSDMLSAGVEPHEVGILTAYLAQKQEIVRAMRSKGLDHMLDIITVDTVDGFQGMERDILLFSATRSNAQRVLGFLADARRMNVMLTRARRGLIVFGHGDTLRYSDAMESHWGSWFDWVDSKGSVIAHADLAASKTNAPAAQSTPTVSSTDAFQSHSVGQQQVGGQASPSFAAASRESAADAAGNNATDAAQGSPVQQPTSAPQTAASPAAWVKVYSEEYKAHYFWNQTTGQTQWETPPGFGGA